MNTIVIQIGNSDDKLSQALWSVFCASVNELIRDAGFTIHFHGHSPGNAPWQNAAWVIEAGDPDSPEAKAFALGLRKLAGEFEQESIAVTLGETEFLKP